MHSKTWRQYLLHLGLPFIQFVVAELRCGQILAVFSKTSLWPAKVDIYWYHATDVKSAAGKGVTEWLTCMLIALHLGIYGGSTFKLPIIMRNKVHLLRTTVFVLSSNISISIYKCHLQSVVIRLKTVFLRRFLSLLIMLHCGQSHMLNALPPCLLLSAFCLTSLPPFVQASLYGWPLTFGWVWLFSGLAFFAKLRDSL